MNGQPTTIANTFGNIDNKLLSGFLENEYEILEYGDYFTNGVSGCERAVTYFLECIQEKNGVYIVDGNGDLYYSKYLQEKSTLNVSKEIYGKINLGSLSETVATVLLQARARNLLSGYHKNNNNHLIFQEFDYEWGSNGFGSHFLYGIKGGYACLILKELITLKPTNDYHYRNVEYRKKEGIFKCWRSTFSEDLFTNLEKERLLAGEVENRKNPIVKQLCKTAQQAFDNIKNEEFISYPLHQTNI